MSSDKIQTVNAKGAAAAYSAPKLVSYGRVSEMTAAGTVSTPEQVSGQGSINKHI